MALDMESPQVKIALDLLRGEDDFCMNYIAAFRAGDLG